MCALVSVEDFCCCLLPPWHLSIPRRRFYVVGHTYAVQYVCASSTLSPVAVTAKISVRKVTTVDNLTSEINEEIKILNIEFNCLIF